MAVCSLSMNEAISYLQKFHLSILDIANSSTEGVMNIALTIICGVLSAFFIFLHRYLTLFLRQNKYAKIICQQFWLIYPLLISFIFASITYPKGYGMFLGGDMGEFVAVLYPTGLRGPNELQIYPGVYAVVGAAAFSGGVTHTISVAVIIFEMTGQIFYILPVMIAVLIANAISSYLQPSIYDSIIKIKHLPYLPDIPATSSRFHGIRAEQIMTKNVRYLSKESTYAEVQRLMLEMPKLRAFPIVEDKGVYSKSQLSSILETMILIGSCSRHEFLHAIETKIGREARKTEANRRIKQAIENNDFEQKNSDNKRDTLIERRPSILSPGFTNMMGSSPNKGSDNRNVAGEISCAKPMPTKRLNDLSMNESESHEDTFPENVNIISEGNGRQAIRFIIDPDSDMENGNISKGGGSTALPNISFSDVESEKIKRNSSMNSLRSCESSQSHRNNLHKSAHEVYKIIKG
uniref:Chloride channel protein n=1 Tax=Acrobeloides nanus TaxID=290746 RepID=A0A914DYL0_9BILA